MQKTILDNVASGIDADFNLPSKEAAVWVSAGAADLKHDGDVIASLAIGERKLVSGLPAGTEMTLEATAAGTTAKVAG